MFPYERADLIGQNDRLHNYVDVSQFYVQEAFCKLAINFEFSFDFKPQQKEAVNCFQERKNVFILPFSCLVTCNYSVNACQVNILKYSSPIPQASELACRLNTVGISDP